MQTFRILILLLTLAIFQGCAGSASDAPPASDVEKPDLQDYEKKAQEAEAKFNNLVTDGLKDGSFRITNGPNLYALELDRTGATENIFHLHADTLFNLTGVKLELAKERYDEKLEGIWFDDQGRNGKIVFGIDYSGNKYGTMTGDGLGEGYKFSFTRSTK